MFLNTLGSGAKESAGRIWRFGQCEFDESSRELRVNGQPADLESKPIDVLHQLLIHAGEVVTRDELFDAVWPGTAVVDSSLATAVSKLRKAIADDDQSIVVTVHRIGYRLGVPAQSRYIAAPTAELSFSPGDPAPGREQWRLLRRLQASAANEIWLAQHPKTQELRVFKFAGDGIRLKGLKREATIARFLRESLGERQDFVRVLEWNFDVPPFYLESQYAGRNLEEWAKYHEGLNRIPMQTRLDILVCVARALSAAHGVGVLHKDLKPGNILVSTQGSPTSEPHTGLQVRVADFGSAALTDPARLSAMGITNLGFTQSENADAQALTGTVLYLAPEVVAGQSPTAGADVYALGVLLYQLVVGDFRRPLSPGWEAEIDDPLIREDIADAACGDPARRLANAALLASRLETLEERRKNAAEQRALRELSVANEARVARARMRRPWLIAAMLTLMAGLAASLILYRRASSERDRANHEMEIAGAVSSFLVGDLLGRGDPFSTGKSDESLIDAVRRASPSIDARFRDAPEVAARLHQAIGHALDSRTAYADAMPEYSRAAALFEKTGGPLDQGAIVVQLQRAAAEARRFEKGSTEEAKTILAREEKRISAIAKPSPEVLVWRAYARGMIALIDGNVKSARTEFADALDRASGLPSFDQRAVLVMKQRLAFTYIRLGEGARAEELFRDLIRAFSRTDGPASPNVLRVRLNLAQAYMVEQKHQQAIDETTRIYPAYIAKLGEEHELSMQVLSTRAESEGSIARWDDAIRDDMKIHAIAAHKQGPESFFAIATLSDASLAQCRSGRLKEGAVNAREAYDTSVRAFGAKAGLTGGAAHTLASCLIELGQLDEASRLLKSIDADAVGQLAGVKNWSANIDLAEADIAYLRKDYPTARRLLANAAPILSDPSAEPYQKQLLTRLTAATAGKQSQ